ncbi:MAG: hypothetical protein JNM19_09600 [Chitinophagaceae bacterium]|nr:hypothetical protein [Chitinophagaceae bacterium]
MKSKYLFVLSCLLYLHSAAQKVDWKKINHFKPDDILLKGERQPTKVLLLGTFHFGYPNLDGHKTDSSKFINVKSAQRQKEMEELATVIRRFNPTRIYVESTDGRWIDSMYKEYLADRYVLGRNEIFQLGFRIAKQQNHSKIYSVDAWPFSNQYSSRYTWIDSLWDVNIPVDSVRDAYWSKKYKEWYLASDSVKLDLTMLEIFLQMAEPSTLQRMHGHYLASGFNTATDATDGGGQQGPDALSIWWYNRNLRIFNKILRTRPSSSDRILVLFGNGHMPILKHCFYSSPEFEVVELKSLLK